MSIAWRFWGWWKCCYEQGCLLPRVVTWTSPVMQFQHVSTWGRGCSCGDFRRASMLMVTVVGALKALKALNSSEIWTILRSSSRWCWGVHFSHIHRDTSFCVVLQCCSVANSFFGGRGYKAQWFDWIRLQGINKLELQRALQQVGVEADQSPSESSEFRASDGHVVHQASLEEVSDMMEAAMWMLYGYISTYFDKTYRW